QERGKRGGTLDVSASGKSALVGAVSFGGGSESAEERGSAAGRSRGMLGKMVPVLWGRRAVGGNLQWNVLVARGGCQSPVGGLRERGDFICAAGLPEGFEGISRRGTAGMQRGIAPTIGGAGQQWDRGR